MNCRHGSLVRTVEFKNSLVETPPILVERAHDSPERIPIDNASPKRQKPVWYIGPSPQPASTFSWGLRPPPRSLPATGVRARAALYNAEVHETHLPVPVVHLPVRVLCDVVGLR